MGQRKLNMLSLLATESELVIEMDAGDVVDEFMRGEKTKKEGSFLRYVWVLHNAVATQIQILIMDM